MCKFVPLSLVIVLISSSHFREAHVYGCLGTGCCRVMCSAPLKGSLWRQ